MKRLCRVLFLYAFVYHQAICIQATTQEVNRLNWIEVYQGKISTQIMLDFSQPIYFKKKIIKDDFQLKLTFPGIRQDQFNTKQVIAKLSQLKKCGLINNIFIQEKNKNIVKMVLILQFQKTREDVDPNNPQQTIKTPNKLLIKWCKTEDPNRLVIDIFSQDALENLKNKNQTVLFVKNDLIASDSDSLIKQQLKKKEIRIALDPGHGGEKTGAKSFNLQEKDLALSIAKKTKLMLQNHGFKVLLTRNNDVDIPLEERSRLAEQLNANVFISIHVNSDGGRGGAASGVETCYLNTKSFVAPTRHGGYLFMNLKKDLSLLELVDDYLKNNAQISQQLALLIQGNLINHLRNHNFNVKDRGIKANGFRVLLRSPIPAALVEVGFLTNYKEAQLLSSENYQENVAYGIFQGITKFISAQY